MNTGTDAELLRSFVIEGDENAFSALVARYAPMVRGVALRCTGEEDLADEVTQTVFTVLTRKASSIPAAHLPGWLHKSASFAALDARRKSRRYQRALAALGRQPDAMNTSEETSDASAWIGIRPHLDEAISNLPEKLRGPVILRFFEGRSIQEIASASGKSEDASRKELQRALERLSGILKRRGILTTGAALSVALGAQDLFAPPASAAAVAAAALKAGPSLAASSALLTQTALFMTTTKTITIAAVAVLAITSGVAIYFFTPGTQAGSQTETRRSPQRLSKAFQYMKAMEAQSRQSRQPPVSATARTAAVVRDDAKLELIKQMRLSGMEFLRQQAPYVYSTDQHSEVNYVLTLGNRLMLAAVLAEMSRSKEYLEQLSNMLQEDGVRRFITESISEYFPALSEHLKQGGKVDAGNLTALFPDSQGFLSEFDTRVAAMVSSEYAAAFEAGIANYIAGDVLAWQAIHSGEWTKKELMLPFFWEFSK